MSCSLFSDPLERFPWDELLARYQCYAKPIDRDHRMLADMVLDSDSDEELYSELVRRIHGPDSSTPRMTFGEYQAIIYWKHYSFPRSLGAIKRGLEGVDTTRENFAELITGLEPVAGRRFRAIKTNLQFINRFEIRGMKTPTSLPTRSTFLHFLYPDIVPIFDRMVLEAVGINTDHDRTANQRLTVFEKYVPFAWCLADRYEAECRGFAEQYASQNPQFQPLTPIRVIDMALWAHRGMRGHRNSRCCQFG